METPAPFVSAAFRQAPRGALGRGPGLHYSGPWNILAAGQRNQPARLADCSLPEAPVGWEAACARCGDSCVVLAGPRWGAGCLCPLMDVLIWGDALLSAWALLTRLLDEPAQLSPRGWERRLGVPGPGGLVG